MIDEMKKGTSAELHRIMDKLEKMRSIMFALFFFSGIAGAGYSALFGLYIRSVIYIVAGCVFGTFISRMVEAVVAIGRAVAEKYEGN